MVDNNVMSFDKYLDWISEVLSETSTPKSFGKRVVIPARRFVPAMEGSLRKDIPLPLAGYTIITPPGKECDQENAAAYDAMSKPWNDLAAVPGLIATPESAWHVTLADLVSQVSYAALLYEGREDELVAEIRQQFKTMASLPCPDMHIKGVGLFTDCVVALLAPANAAAYDVLLKFRDRVYTPGLEKLGVKRPEPYGFHITLAYVESYLCGAGRRKLTEMLKRINNRWEPAGIPFIVHTASFSKFKNMSAFTTTGFPSFRFESRGSYASSGKT